MTSLQKQLKQHELWVALDKKVQDYALTLLKNEFIETSKIKAFTLHRLKKILQFVSKYNLHYQKVIQQNGLSGWSPENIEQWQSFPALSKNDTRDHFENLCSQALPKGDVVQTLRKTSGTTGHPTKIYHCKRRIKIKPLFWQNSKNLPE